jgi:alpha-tubulin suppressor-like RCC1 family protein
MPTTSFRFTGADLDTLFEPIGSSSKRADVSYRVAGTDISNYYYSVDNGGTAFGTTNFEAGGVDIGTMFAAVGTVSTAKFLYIWGEAVDGQLGFVTDSYSWTVMSAGATHTAAIRSDNLLFTWGYGVLGRLGNGTNVNRSSPVQIGSSSWTAVSAGLSHTAAIRSDNLLFTWGYGLNGRLGDGTTVTKSSPVQIGSSSWTAVSAGGTHTAGLKRT